MYDEADLEQNSLSHNHNDDIHDDENDIPTAEDEEESLEFREL